MTEFKTNIGLVEIYLYPEGKGYGLDVKSYSKEQIDCYMSIRNDRSITPEFYNGMDKAAILHALEEAKRKEDCPQWAKPILERAAFVLEDLIKPAKVKQNKSNRAQTKFSSKVV